jgi:hypothetical protein
VRIDAIVTLITRHSGPRGGIRIPVCLCCALWIVTAKKKKRQARDVSGQGDALNDHETRRHRDRAGKSVAKSSMLQSFRPMAFSRMN